jgi:hypothetical protein
MLQTRYHPARSESEIQLRGPSAPVLEAARVFVKNVTPSNPARAELLEQISDIERSIEQSRDCEIAERKHGYLRSVFLNLFDEGRVEMVCGSHVYTCHMVKKEAWSEGQVPGHQFGGYGGFQYRTTDGSIVFRQATWIS